MIESSVWRCVHQPTGRLVRRGVADPCGCVAEWCEPCSNLVVVELCLDHSEAR